MKHPDERVALQAVEFWSTVCEEEVDLAIELQEARLFLDDRIYHPANYPIIGPRIWRTARERIQILCQDRAERDRPSPVDAVDKTRGRCRRR
jgi:hypothetical protein